MKQFICFFSGLLLLFVSTTRVVAQEVSDYSQLSEEDYTKIVLPPLSVLFENAKNSPIYEMADVKARIERKLLQKEKWSFLGFFSLRGSYQYGMFGNESTYTDVALAPYLTYSTQAQNGYTVGAAEGPPAVWLTTKPGTRPAMELIRFVSFALVKASPFTSSMP